VIPTQFGHVPDVAFEEIKQMRYQQQQQPVSLPFFAPTFVSTTSSPSINTPSNNETLFLSSNQARPTARDVSVNNSTGGTSRSRSLANNQTNRSSIAAASTNVSNPAYQTSLFTTNKQTFLTPTRFGIGRLNPPTTNNSNPSGPSSSSTSYISNRNLPISTSPNIKHRTNPHQQQSTAAAGLSNSSSLAATTTTANNGQQRSHYETTYRSSFIKPLVP
jgi:hypothetical protein